MHCFIAISSNVAGVGLRYSAQGGGAAVSAGCRRCRAGALSALRSVILIINSCLCRGLGSALSKEAVATEPFIPCFRSKVHPPCPEQQQVYHKAFAGFAVCRGWYYSPDASSCKCSAVTGIAEPGAGIQAAGDAICACQGRPQGSFGAVFLSRQCSCRSVGPLVKLEPQELHLSVGTRV